MRFCSAKALALTGSLSENSFSFLAAHPFMGKTSAQRGETDTGLLPQQTHWGLCELGRQGRKWHWLPHTPSSVSASTGQAAQDTLAAGMEAALGLVSAGGQEAPSTEANRFWELQRCESNRADFCQDIFEELQTLASGRVLSPPPLNASAVPATYRTQCCPPPRHSPAIGLGSPPHHSLCLSGL